jgi:hypothetical protein
MIDLPSKSREVIITDTGLRNLVEYDGSGQERDWIVGVALDETNGHIYWSEKGSAAGGDGRNKLAYVADLGGHIWEVPGPGHARTTARVVVDVGFPVTGLNLIHDS